MQGLWKNNISSFEKYNHRRKQSHKHFFKDKRNLLRNEEVLLSKHDSNIYRKDINNVVIINDFVVYRNANDSHYKFKINIYKRDRNQIKACNKNKKFNKVNFIETKIVKLYDLSNYISKINSDLTINRICFNKFNIIEKYGKQISLFSLLNKEHYFILKDINNEKDLFKFSNEYEYELILLSKKNYSDFNSYCSTTYEKKKPVQTKDIVYVKERVIERDLYTYKEYYYNKNIETIRNRHSLYNIKKKPYKKQFIRQERAKLRLYLNKNRWNTICYDCVSEICFCFIEKKIDNYFEEVCCPCLDNVFYHENYLNGDFETTNGARDYKWHIL